MNKEKKPVGKTIPLISEGGEQRWPDQKTNGSLWGGGAESFASETEAKTKGWKVEAVKIVFESPDGKRKC
jgi:hypothetical protein